MPNPLTENARIALVAPAGRIFRQELDFALNWAKKQGWQVVFSEELFREHNFGYFYAGHDEHRLKLVQEALNNKEIDAIWFARGGYGSVRLIDQLDFTEFLKNPKWIIGYSDITVFHNHLNNKDISTLHAVTAKQLNVAYSTETYDSLAKVLKGESLQYQLPSAKINICGAASGKLVGGNLSIIYSLLGSDSFIQGEDLILFIEDWQENWYHIDRMLFGLKRSGLLQRIKGMIVGSFTKMDTKEENSAFDAPYDAVSNQIVQAFVKDLGIPVAFQFPAGHIGDNRALILGREVTLKVTPERVSLNWPNIY